MTNDPDAIADREFRDPQKLARHIGALVERVRPSLRPGASALAYILPLSGRFGHIVQEPWILRTLFGDKYDQLILVTGNRRHWANPLMFDVLSTEFTIIETPSPIMLAMGFLTQGVVRLPGFDFYMASPERAYRDLANGVASGRRPKPYDMPESVLGPTRAFLESRGIDRGQPLVVLHVRDAAYLPQFSYHAFRFADVANYLPAVRHLLERGYCVCRVGDANSPALGIDSPSYIEVMRQPDRSPAIDIGLLARARFAIASPSGPYATAQTFLLPSLVVNVVPQQTYFHAPGEVFVFKPVVQAATDRQLTYEEVLRSGAAFFSAQREYEAAGLAVGQNTPDELLGAVTEMADRIEGRFTPSPAVQDAFLGIGAAFHAEIHDVAPWRETYRDWYAMAFPGVNICEDFARRNPAYLDRASSMTPQS